MKTVVRLLLLSYVVWFTLPMPFTFAVDGFKVESAIIPEGDAGKAVKMTTLFSEGIIYDFIEDKGQGEITIIDLRNDQFILLDPVCRLQTRFKASELKAMIDSNRPKFAQSDRKDVAFAAKPVFDETVDETSGMMKFQCPWIDYTIETHAEETPELVDAYFDFCDWSCYLNCRINIGAIHPLMRLEVNRAMRGKKRLPDKVVALIYPNGKKLLAKRDRLESTHTYSLRLSEVDQRRIADALSLTRLFKTVPLGEYQQAVSAKLLPSPDSKHP